MVIGNVVVETWTFLQIQLFYLKNRISVTPYARLLPSLLFSLKHMACHVSYAARIATWRTLLTEAFFGMSNEISPILVTRFLGSEWRNIFKRTFVRSLLKHQVEGGEINSNYTGNCKAFWVTRKRKKLIIWIDQVNVSVRIVI